MSVSKSRAVIPASPELPYPVPFKGQVIRGFGRGSKELNIPTANISTLSLPATLSDVGVYFGYAKVRGEVYNMVMSVGFNPYFKNEEKSVEVHIINKFDFDFYGDEIQLLICGWLRPEYDYTSKDDLILDIKEDIRSAMEALVTDPYGRYRRELSS